jgi:radical SAM protein with 4Fe4S-binding SPASM domain
MFNRRLGFMDFDLFKHVVNDAWSVTDTVNFSFFGEPMLHPRFLDCIDYLRSRPRRKRVVVFSNMTCSTKEIMRALIDSRISRLKISLDAFSSETFEKIRAGSHCLDLEGNRWDGDRFSMVTEKVEYWFKMKDHRPTRHEFVVSSMNVHELEPFVRKWHPLLGKNDDILSKSILSYGGVILKDVFLNKQPCNIWGREHQLVVDWQGNVSPCNLDVNMEMKIGKVPDQKLSDIWQSKAYRRIKSQSITRSISPCANCIDANNRSRDVIYTRDKGWNARHAGMYKIGNWYQNRDCNTRSE